LAKHVKEGGKADADANAESSSERTQRKSKELQRTSFPFFLFQAGFQTKTITHKDRQENIARARHPFCLDSELSATPVATLEVVAKEAEKC